MAPTSTARSRASRIRRFDDDLAALKATRTLLGYLPQSYDGENPDVAPYDDPDRKIGPQHDHPRLTTESVRVDMREVVKRVVDGHSLLLLSEDYAPNIITAFALEWEGYRRRGERPAAPRWVPRRGRLDESR